MEYALTPLEGVRKERIKTERLTINCLRSGDGSDTVLFVHGNVSSAAFWEETMTALPDGFSAWACDLRGYGETEAKPVDATKGLDDMVGRHSVADRRRFACAVSPRGSQHGRRHRHEARGASPRCDQKA